jgi:hypothetical protein
LQIVFLRPHIPFGDILAGGLSALIAADPGNRSTPGTVV